MIRNICISFAFASECLKTEDYLNMMGQTKELLQIIREAEQAENEVRETVKKSKKVRNKGGFLSRFFRSSKD